MVDVRKRVEFYGDINEKSLNDLKGAISAGAGIDLYINNKSSDMAGTIEVANDVIALINKNRLSVKIYALGQLGSMGVRVFILSECAKAVLPGVVGTYSYKGDNERLFALCLADEKEMKKPYILFNTKRLIDIAASK